MRMTVSHVYPLPERRVLVIFRDATVGYAALPYPVEMESLFPVGKEVDIRAFNWEASHD